MGGAERELVTFLRAAPRRGYEFAVASLAPGGGFREEVEDLIGQSVLTPPSRDRIRRLWWMRSTVQKAHPDLIHAWSLFPLFYLKFVFLRRPCPIIGFLQSVPDQWSESKAHPRLSLYLAQTTDFLMANSMAAISGVVARGARVRRWAVVQNGVQPEFLAGKPTRETLSRKRERPVVVGLGQLVPRKRPDWMIRVIAELRGRGTDFDLWLVGDGSERANLGDLAKALDVSDRVVFWGMRSDVPALLSTADVLLHCAVTEGSPNAVQEAMAVGLPIVAPRTSGIPEILDHGVEGFLYDPQDFSACAAALHSLLQDADQRRTMGAAARRRAESAFQPALMAERILACYHEVLDAAGGSLRSPVSNSGPVAPISPS